LKNNSNDFELFQQMRWDWEKSLNEAWISSNESIDLQIAIIAGQLYLLNKLKKLDRFEKAKPSRSLLDEQRRRALTVDDELTSRKLPWAFKVLMPQ
jgi:hypothetical protein